MSRKETLHKGSSKIAIRADCVVKLLPQHLVLLVLSYAGLATLSQILEEIFVLSWKSRQRAWRKSWEASLGVVVIVDIPKRRCIGHSFNTVASRGTPLRSAFAGMKESFGHHHTYRLNNTPKNMCRVISMRFQVSTVPSEGKMALHISLDEITKVRPAEIMMESDKVETGNLEGAEEMTG